MTLGLKDLYYAVCTEADGAESYGTPKKMAEAMSADLSVKTADGSLYADDTLSESVTEFASPQAFCLMKYQRRAFFACSRCRLCSFFLRISAIASA